MLFLTFNAAFSKNVNCGFVYTLTLAILAHWLTFSIRFICSSLPIQVCTACVKNVWQLWNASYAIVIISTN